MMRKGNILLAVAVLSLLIGCDTEDSNGELATPETTSPTTSQGNDLLPNPNQGQGLPSGASLWNDVPSQGDPTTGHNPESPWTNWDGIAR